jgi:hypothetical protein
LEPCHDSTMTELIAVYALVAVTIAIFIGALAIVLLTAHDIRKSTRRLLDRHQSGCSQHALAVSRQVHDWSATPQICIVISLGTSSCSTLRSEAGLPRGAGRPSNAAAARCPPKTRPHDAASIHPQLTRLMPPVLNSRYRALGSMNEASIDKRGEEVLGTAGSCSALDSINETRAAAPPSMRVPNWGLVDSSASSIERGG